MNKVKIKSYGDIEVDIPIIVISGDSLRMINDWINAIGIDPYICLTVNTEEEIEVFKTNYYVFFCNKFEPSIDYIRSNRDIVFLSTSPRFQGNDFPDRSNYRYCNVEKDDLSELAEFTGITAFKNLRYDADINRWIHIGQAVPTIKHNPKQLASRFTKETIKWIAAGKPYRSKANIEALYQICRKCSEFRKHKRGNTSSCNICGCRISSERQFMNKLAWSTTECPAIPPRWTAETSVSEESIKGREIELYNQYISQLEALPESESFDCGCG